MNEALRQAMAKAGVTGQQLAEKCDVDVKTVNRWVSNPTRIPHARHRWMVCKALGVEEADLWPSAVRVTLKTGPDREIVQVFPYRSAAPASLWRTLVSNARRELTFAGYTNYFLWLEHANFGNILKRKAANGCRVRFLIGDPKSETTRERESEENVPLTLSTRIAVTTGELQKLRGLGNLEARFETGHVNLSVFRFDNDMIVTPILARRVGHDSPMLHIRREQNDGMFDRFNDHVEELWSRGVSIWEDGHHGTT
ncbi:helix-turn-helix transcriptional regulator [Nocardia sp. NBC_00508]|uniref:helix-turn-helix domain-containing protein n=1 Tax=Nocardia sp. NBC_00508 TaxID=2975992 RepID=UPI002E81FD24|nr:helix-turn-helix transcriptional regulator [Nocardia sp. NBC_00508]WUD69543.1 helix-turn-helix transcriptional regulator [Nocardia sp. NBC_00508]